MATISSSSVMTVSARKILKRQVVLMIGKRFCALRYAGGGEGGLPEKKLGCGVTYAHKSERSLEEKGSTKAKI